MSNAKTKVRPSDLPTKRVRAADGSVIRMKVVQSESETLADDILAAFRSNVRRITTERRRGAATSANAEEG